VRVVAGVARGRRLGARLPPHVRPTTDRVREAIFAALDARVGLDGAAVADLYCGSGAMGIEALSRGAASCVFVDDDARCLAAARANLEAVGLADADARFVRARLPDRVPALRADVVVCDPPYGSEGLEALVAGLDAEVCVLETDRALGGIDGWVVVTERRYGTTLVTMLARDHGEPRE
jgi:16S rRNA (guanine966-N2)-methyltransferase